MRLRIILCGGAAALALAACGGGGGSGALPPGPLRVVAAENVYGDIAAQIGTSDVIVTSLLTSPSADPHLFEAGTAAGLAVSQAAVVIDNGFGYDAFIDKLLASTKSKARVLTLASVLPFDLHNPHLWYAVAPLAPLGAAIERTLAAADPAHAADYEQGLTRFLGTLGVLRAELTRIARLNQGAPIAYTEPVAGYLAVEAGLTNLAPPAFTLAIQNGSEPPPAAVAAMDRLIATHEIRVLIYNSQAVSPITRRLRSAALAAGIGVVPFTELLPPGLTFQQWQLEQMRVLEHALAR